MTHLDDSLTGERLDSLSLCVAEAAKRYAPGFSSSALAQLPRA
jgi:hypothetical protein